MNQKRLSRFTVSAIATAITTPLCLGIVPEAIAQSAVEFTEPQATQHQELNPSALMSNAAPPSLDAETTTSVSPESAQTQNLIAQIYTHAWGDEPAVTLYIRGIPVLTFIDPATPIARSKSSGFVAPPPQAKPINLSDESVEETVRSNDSDYDPVWRATNVAARLNYLNQNNLDANSITVGWNEDLNAYLIRVGDEPLVTIDNRTILPDTTRNFTQDALQATNRLRRLLGGASPLNLNDIEVRPEAEVVPPRPNRDVLGLQQGVASWYGPGFHGRRSASGERFNQNAMTAAHRTLPFGTMVRVTNLNNGQSIVVRINDRGPFSGGRVIDLSAGAARKIGMMRSGVAPVQLEILGR